MGWTLWKNAHVVVAFQCSIDGRSDSIIFFISSLVSGHVHLTDFNIATVLEEGTLATSMSGTKPYMGKNIYIISSILLEWFYLTCELKSNSQCVMVKWKEKNTIEFRVHILMCTLD